MNQYSTQLLYVSSLLLFLVAAATAIAIAVAIMWW